MIRAFCAIRLSVDILTALSQIQDQLRQDPAGDAARFVRPASIHLTLRFLGDVEERRMPQVYAAAQEAARASSPFSVQLGRLGCFPNARRPRVLWAGVCDSHGELQRLQRSLETNLEREGFGLAARRFSPHLTLARIKRRADPDLARELARSLEHLPDAQGSMTVDTIHVIKSELYPQGPTYTVMHSAPLG